MKPLTKKTVFDGHSYTMDEMETRRKYPMLGSDGKRIEEGSEMERPLLQDQMEVDSLYRMSTEKKMFQLNREGGDTGMKSDQRGLSSMAKGIEQTELYGDYENNGMEYDVSRLVKDAERMFGNRMKGNVFNRSYESLEDVRNQSKIEEALQMMASFNQEFENRFDQKLKPSQGHNYSTILNDTTLLGGIQANESINPGMNITLLNEKRGLNKKLGIDESTMLQETDMKRLMNQSFLSSKVDLDYGALKMEMRCESSQLVKEASLAGNPRSELSAYLESAKKNGGDRGNVRMSQAARSGRRANGKRERSKG